MTTPDGWRPNEAVKEAAERYNRASALLNIARRDLRRALDGRASLKGHLPGVCGTPAGYRRHVRDLEPADDACREAMAWERDRTKARRR